jgi:hypothetical protein
MDDLIAGFKNSMTIAGLVAGGDENTDVQTPAGLIPSLAKQAKQAREKIDAVVGDGSAVVRTDTQVTYTSAQATQARKNIGLENVDNTPDLKKPMSEQVSAAMNDALSQIRACEQAANKDTANGYPGLNSSRLTLISTVNTTKGYLANNNTVARSWTLPSKDGVLATLADITGTNSGTNTGDETQASILQKLGISTLSGSNTGDFDSVVTVANAAALPNQGVPKRLYITLDLSTMYYWNGVGYQQLNVLVSDTNSVPEGTQNLYFTQLRAIQSVLTTYVAGTTGAVAASDTVVNAISKLQTQINGAVNDYVAKLLLKENLSNKATDFSTVNNTLYPSVQAVKTYADSLVVGLLKDCGNWDASTNAFPTTGGSGTGGAVKKGNMWYVSVAGTLGGVAVNVGDSFRALVDAPGQTAANWAVLESNLGYVPYNATNPAGYISGITGSMVTTALGYTPIKTTDKNAANGVVGLNGYAITVVNALGTISSKLTTDATAVRTWKLPDKDGTLATIDDLQGTSSGVNTGDETQASILQKLGISSISGVNTGDQTITLTGDVTGTGTGSFAATIAPNAVTLAKMTQVANGVMLGRASAGSGNIETLNATQVKALLTLDQVNNTSDANKPVSTAQQTALNLKENSANKAIDFSVVDNVKFPTTLAVKTLLDSRLTNVVVDCGNWDASGGTYPTTGGTGTSGAIKKGNLFFVSVAGTIGGIAVNIGDSIRALVDTPGQTAANWDILESNLGYVPYNASNPAGYISAITSGMVTTALGYTPVSPASKDASSGFPGLAGFKLNLKNNAGTVTSTLENNNTAIRTYVLPDKSGTLATTADITGTNSGTNTGDETQATILSKLGISSISGSNTGDETQASIKSKLGVSTLSGSNTGDETQASILQKLTYTPVNKGGDTMAGVLNFAPAASLASAATINLDSVLSNVVEITGNTTISAINLADGHMRFVRFASSLILTENNVIDLPTGSNIKTQAGDWAVFVGRASGVTQCLNYMTALGVPIFGNARERSRTVIANTASTVIDLNNGDGATVFKVYVQANTTLTFTNPPPSPNGEFFNFTVITINDATGGRAMSFGNTIQWAGGLLPPRTTTANAKDVWTFYVDDAAVYAGSLSIADQR